MSDLQLYTIMPLDVEHVDAICDDIERQYQDGVATCALFMMTLVPEGDPPVNKAEVLCRKYDLFRDKLREKGIGSGILVQATIGHGWVLSEMFPFQRYINVNDGAAVNVVCPYDEGFRDYIFRAMQTIASHQPDCVMVDDDFRLIFRDGSGCGCPLHLERFERLTGKKLSREQLWEAVCHDRKAADAFVATQKESLTEAAKIMRAGLDSINPALPGSFCCVGANAEFGYEIASILAGEGNPTVVRINNGNYTAAGARFFSDVFFRAATQIEKLKGKVDVLLDEPDTCPQNRYSTGAMSLHTHMTGSILEGATGAKHWITRLIAHEPNSGKAYRQILKKHSGFYKALAQIVPTLSWHGFRMPILKEARYDFGKNFGGVTERSNAWCSCVLERMGLPVYFSSDPGGILCLEGELAALLSEEEIKTALSGTVFLASDAAKILIDRGFDEYLGVDVRPWTGVQPSTERLFVNNNKTKVQQKYQELVPCNENVKEDSSVYHSVDEVHFDYLFPGTTVYKNSFGGTAVVFCGTPMAVYNIIEAFSFLNESRKEQLIRLAKGKDLPAYYVGDEELYFRAASTPDNSLFCALFNIGLDPMEEIKMWTEKEVTKVQKLMPNGTWQTVAWKKEADSIIIDAPCFTLDPVILIMK